MGRTLMEVEAKMTTVGSGDYTYTLIENWAKLPAGETWGNTSAVATDSQDRVYVFQRKDPPVMIFDRDGNFLNSWGISAITDPHGIFIEDDIIYLTDRADSVALKFTLDGKALQVIGRRGVHSNTECEIAGELVPQASGPFKYPTELVPAPSGDLYVSDGYRNARVHRFSPNGRLLASWGEPGKEGPNQFHLPHSILVDPGGLVYVCDRENNRIQGFYGRGPVHHYVDRPTPPPGHLVGRRWHLAHQRRRRGRNVSAGQPDDQTRSVGGPVGLHGGPR